MEVVLGKLLVMWQQLKGKMKATRRRVGRSRKKKANNVKHMFWRKKGKKYTDGTSAVWKPRHNQLDHPCFHTKYWRDVSIKIPYSTDKLAAVPVQTLLANKSSMDADLKSLLVSTEELSLAVNSQMGKLQHRDPVAWWNRSCDIALLIGTFVHGLGKYEAMLNDDALPFAFKILKFSKSDEAYKAAHCRFNGATAAACKVFDDAFELVKLKAQEEV
jgi:hypothetical protein